MENILFIIGISLFVGFWVAIVLPYKYTSYKCRASNQCRRKKKIKIDLPKHIL